MEKRKGCLTAVITVSILLGVLAGGIVYRTDYAKTEVVTCVSEDGRHTLTIYMIGEPEWPFGPTHCRVDLMEDSRRITKYPFSIRDDGAPAGEGNFRIGWHADGVRVTVSGSEQRDQEYMLYFDGRTEQGG